MEGWEIHHIVKINTLLNNQWIKEVTKAIRKYLETNENKNTTLQNLWDTVKVVYIIYTWGKGVLLR